MKNVDLYLKVRHAVRIEGLSERAAARRFGIDPRTVNKMMKFSVPPGYVRKKPPAKPKLDPFILVIDGILDDDKSRPKKQQHTAKRIFERLRDEHGFTGGITIVKDYVAGWRQRTQEMFVPLVHPPGHAQADFGEAIGVIGGVERKIHFFAFDLPQSDAGFVVGYPAETMEAFCDGHVQAFAFFGGVPKSILYDNTKIAVARIGLALRPLYQQPFRRMRLTSLFVVMSDANTQARKARDQRLGRAFAPFDRAPSAPGETERKLLDRDWPMLRIAAQPRRPSAAARPSLRRQRRRAGRP